jgi:hypothetical protein
MLFYILDDDSFVHPNIINSELHELLLRLPKTPNSPKIEKFGILTLFRLVVGSGEDEEVKEC